MARGISIEHGNSLQDEPWRSPKNSSSSKNVCSEKNVIYGWSSWALSALFVILSENFTRALYQHCDKSNRNKRYRKRWCRNQDWRQLRTFFWHYTWTTEVRTWTRAKTCSTFYSEMCFFSLVWRCDSFLLSWENHLQAHIFTSLRRTARNAQLQNGLFPTNFTCDEHSLQLIVIINNSLRQR